MASEEENGWIAAAAAIDGGKGLPLEKFDPEDKEDMKDLYDALKVSNIGAKSRLRRFVRRIRQQPVLPPGPSQQQPQLSQLSETDIAGLKLMAEEAMAKKRTIVLSEVSMTTKDDLIDMLGSSEVTAVWPNKPDL